MAHDVFISYSSHDKPIADGICANLESAGLRCWIAPRDIVEGEDWPTAIAQGIGLAKVMVLVFSQNSNMSDEVSRELYLAANNKLAIIPFVIVNVVPDAGKAYYMGRTHWMDAMNPPTQEQIGKLTKRVKSLVERVETEGRVASVLAPVVPPYFRKSLNRKYGWIIPVVELVVAAVLVVGSVFTVGKVTGAFSQATATPTPTATPTATPTGVPTPSPSATPVPVLLSFAYREDFNDPQFDGTLPPGVSINGDACSGATATQENGSLTVKTPKGRAFHCGVNLGGGEYKLSQINAVEYSMSSAGVYSNHSGFALSMFSHGSLSFSCGLSVLPGGSGCGVSVGSRQVFQTTMFPEKVGTKYTFRVEVLDPVKMTLRFIVNGAEIGEYTPSAADAAANRAVNFFPMIDVNPVKQPSSVAGTYSLGYLAIEQP